MRLIFLALIQSLFLCGGQLCMKLALSAMGEFAWSWSFFGRQFTNWWWLACGISFITASLLWMYILKTYPFSQAYPLASMAYVFGMIAAILVFHEQVVLTQWIGVLLIMGGCYLVAN